MLDEIRQQPEALANTLAAMDELRLRRPKLVLLVARGTSDNAAQFGKYLIEITTGIPVSLAAPSVLTLYGRALDLTDVLVVGISQSGESTDTNAVLEDARSRGAVTVGITNEAGSTMARICAHALLARAGKEESIAATKTYTCQLLALYLLAHALGGNVNLEALRRLPEWVAQALVLEDTIAAIAERYTFMTHAIVVGRGLNYANALEFGLKLMETCYVVAERFSAADLMHGPIAMIERSFPVFVFAPPGVTRPSISEALRRIKELNAETLVITDAPNAEAGRSIPVPADIGSGDLYTPIPYIVPAQLFAAHLARIKGLNPDQPRTLHKITFTM
jgi:glucosamine--fructose-6-phosphate aminotransferase (isomerizing)